MFGFKKVWHSSTESQILFPWTCRKCSGKGYTSHEYEPERCNKCRGRGYVLPTYDFRVWLTEWRWIYEWYVKAQLIQKCDCGKVEKVLWFDLGSCYDCIPF